MSEVSNAPPPAPPLPPSSSSPSALQTNRLFYKKSAATTFKARDKILSDHIIKASHTTSSPNEIDEQTLNKKTVHEIRRRLEDKLISHVNNSASTGDNKNGDSFELQTNVLAPIKGLPASYHQTGFDDGDKGKNQTQSYRYFGTSNGSDYALRGRINEIIRLGSACLYKQNDNKIYEIDEETEETLAAVGGVATKILPEEQRFETNWGLPKDQEVKFEFI